ncbi:PAS domain-containing sensor histidine kinase [Sphingopyxis fribergensis]
MKANGWWASAALAGVIAIGIFAVDMFSPLGGAIAVLYTLCILLLARSARPGLVALGGVVCAAAALLAFAAGHWGEALGGAHVRLGVSLSAIAVTSVLSYGILSTRKLCSEQAHTLGLTHDSVIVLDRHDRVTAWNDGAELIYGWRADEAIGRDYGELIELDTAREPAKQALGQSGGWTGEMAGSGKDGVPFVVSTRLVQRRNLAGAADGLIEASIDLSAQRRADAARRVSENRYQAIFNAAGFAAWETDWTGVRAQVESMALEGEALREYLLAHPERLRELAATPHIHEANQAAADLFGVADRAGLIGKNVIARYPETNGLALATLFSRLAAGEDLVEVETQIVNLEGRLLDVVLRVRLVPEGEPWSRVLIMAIDMTERNADRARLEQNMVELAHASRVSILGQLAASIAHEVNQPLSAIMTYAKSGRRWLKRDTPDLDEVATCLERIDANGERAAAIITRVRNLARKGSAQIEPILLADLVDEGVALIDREACAAKVPIRTAIEPADLRVAADRVQIQQILVNLMMNAIHASAEAAAPRDIEVTACADADAMARIEVRDRGTGIRGIEPQALFEAFYTTKADGMGMGLSISRSIVEAHGGRIHAANNPDRGATMSFTLPVAN